MPEQKNVKGTARHPLLCRWWLRPSKNAPPVYADGKIGGVELVVPLWALPLELLHRAIFGRAKLDFSLLD